MDQSCLEKQRHIEFLFASCRSREEKYEKIIRLGRDLSPIDPAYKTEKHLIPGCQSKLYLRTTQRSDGTLFFEAEADALLSAGLAALLIMAYSGELPETVLTCEPLFLSNLDIGSLLSPSRSNGLYHIHLRMKQEALTLFKAFFA